LERRQNARNKRQHGDEPQTLLDKKRASSRGRMRNQMEHHWKTWKKKKKLRRKET